MKKRTGLPNMNLNKEMVTVLIISVLGSKELGSKVKSLFFNCIIRLKATFSGHLGKRRGRAVNCGFLTQESGQIYLVNQGEPSRWLQAFQGKLSTVKKLNSK